MNGKRLNDPPVVAEVRGQVGMITLNRPQALNALSLPMVRDITTALLAWRSDDTVQAVLLQGAGREGKPPAFCAGGDIRFLHQAALAGDPALEDFFTEEYSLNHLIPTYGKPTLVLMDGVTMGGGMGLAQGCSLRVVTEHSRIAMPETRIGFFPDVGGGWFLSRCPGHVGEYLALTGQVLEAADAVAVGLADVFIASESLPGLLESLTDQPMENGMQALATARARAAAPTGGSLADHRAAIDRHFGLASVQAVAASLAADGSAWAGETLETLRQRSPLMMAVTLEQLRRARSMSLADELRMERGLVRHCFHRPGAASETVEGIRALAIDKDHQPRWQPATFEELTEAMVAPFFASPWPPHAHPLRDLA